ncbi:unnamed protein product [Closterium sp. NIES-54]
MVAVVLVVAVVGNVEVEVIEVVEVRVVLAVAVLAVFEVGLERREVLSPLELREWFDRRWGRATGAGGTTAAAGSGGSCSGGAGPGGTTEAAGVGPTGGSAGASAGPGAAGSAGTGVAGATGVGAARGVGAGGSADAGTSGGAGAGAAGAGGATDAGALVGSPGAVPAGSGGATRPRPYFVPLLEHVLGLPPSPGPAPPLECPQPVQSQSLFQPVSPLPAPSPYTGPTGGLAERRAPASRPASPARLACTSRRTSRPRPLAVPGTHQMTLRPSTAPLRVPLPSPPESPLLVLADPASDSLRAASPTVARFLATVVTDPSLASTAASALVAELVDFAAHCRLDYAASLVAESASVCPPSVGGADVTIRTGHKSLQYLRSQPTFNPRQIKWLDYLESNFSYTITYKKGAKNIANALTRPSMQTAAVLVTRTNPILTGLFTHVQD